MQYANTVKQIERAFLTTPRPQELDLLRSDLRDDSDIALLYGVPHWLDLSDEAIEERPEALRSLSPAGFRHFLPAFLCWILRHPGRSAVLDHAVQALTREGFSRGDASDHFGCLDKRQREALIAFFDTLQSLGNAADTRSR